MHLRSHLGDDASDDPNITTDDSGMSVVTVTASQGWPWYVWLALLAGGYFLLAKK